MTHFVPHQKEALRTAMEYVYVAGVPGDVAEFGCFFGKSTQMLADAMWEMEKRYQGADGYHKIPTRNLWGFDSFKGFPEPSHPVDAASPHVQAGLWYAGQPAGGSPEAVRHYCAQFLDPERVKIVEGWYADTLPCIPRDTRFAFLHMDCDFYESTFQVLDHLFERSMVSDGCTILFDDWYCNRGSPDFGQQRAWHDARAKRERFRFTDWGP